MKTELNPIVCQFLAEKKLPLLDEINLLRAYILASFPHLEENIKWNSPNYSVAHTDYLTLRIFPTHQIQLVLHCGAKKTKPIPAPLIADETAFLVWKDNTRAIKTFTNRTAITNQKVLLQNTIKQ